MKSLLTLFCVLACGFLFAQPDLPDDPVPLDGGIIALLAAGAMYGAKKIKLQKIK